MSNIFTLKSKSEWILRGHSLSREKKLSLNWSRFLPIGKGTQHQRAYLLAGSKELLLSMFDTQHSSQKQGRSPETIMQRFTDIKALVNWMVDRDVWGFNKLSPADVINFLKDRKSRGGGPINSKTIDFWIRLFNRMWVLRSTYRGAIRFEADAIKDEIRGAIVQRHNIPWKSFKEEDAISIVRDALGWLDKYGAFLVSSSNQSWDDFDRLIGLTKRQRTNYRKKFYEKLEVDPVFTELRVDLNEPTLATHKVLSKAVTSMEGAIAALLLILVGFRISELAALNSDCLVQKTVDGESLHYLQGIAAKRSGLPRQWVACEPVPTAVQYLIEFNARLRSSSKTDALFLSRPIGSPVGLPARRVSRSSREQLSKKMKAFVMAPYRENPPVRCHPHMARKSFAQLAVKRDKSALEPVAHHLGHAYKEFTDGAYVGSDFELMDLLQDEDRRELAEALTDLLSRPCAGKGGAALKRLTFRGKTGLSDLVDSLISKGVQIAPCNWGYCVYSVSLSACKGGAKGPNEVNRAPELCASCANFSVTEKHREWWNERAKREEAFLRQTGLSDQTKKLVEIRLNTSNRVLREISDSCSNAVEKKGYIERANEASEC